MPAKYKDREKIVYMFRRHGEGNWWSFKKGDRLGSEEERFTRDN